MFLVGEINQNNLIPAVVVANWENFAIALGFKYGEVDVFKQSASHLDVQECSEKMLRRWWETHSNHDVADLITALQVIEENSYAHQLEQG